VSRALQHENSRAKFYSHSTINKKVFSRCGNMLDNSSGNSIQLSFSSLEYLLCNCSWFSARGGRSEAEKVPVFGNNPVFHVRFWWQPCLSCEFLVTTLHFTWVLLTTLVRTWIIGLLTRRYVSVWSVKYCSSSHYHLCIYIACQLVAQ